MRFSLFIGKLLLVGWNVSSALARCDNPPSRKDIRELTPQETAKFHQAIRTLHSKKIEFKSYSQHEYFAQIHNTNSIDIHKNPKFLPWHRHFIRKYEMELQKIDPKIVLPYWDWSVDASMPHSSPVLDGMYMGGNGDRFNGQCLTKGPYANWYMKYPEPHCLKRSYNKQSTLSSFAYPEELQLLLNEPSFSVFSQSLEEKHGIIHVSLGGDMSSQYAPNDPIFYLHHVFMDLLWAEWQRRHPNSQPYEGKAYKVNSSVKDRLPFYKDFNIQSTLDTKEGIHCYTYDRYPRLIFTKDTPRDEQIQARNLLSTNPILNGKYSSLTLSQFIKVSSGLQPVTNKGPRWTGNEFELASPDSYVLKQSRNRFAPNPQAFDYRAQQTQQLLSFINNNPSFVSLSKVDDAVEVWEEHPQWEQVVENQPVFWEYDNSFDNRWELATTLQPPPVSEFSATLDEPFMNILPQSEQEDVKVPSLIIEPPVNNHEFIESNEVSPQLTFEKPSFEHNSFEKPVSTLQPPLSEPDNSTLESPLSSDQPAIIEPEFNPQPSQDTWSSFNNDINSDQSTQNEDTFIQNQSEFIPNEPEESISSTFVPENNQASTDANIIGFSAEPANDSLSPIPEPQNESSDNSFSDPSLTESPPSFTETQQDSSFNSFDNSLDNTDPESQVNSSKSPNVSDWNNQVPPNSNNDLPSPPPNMNNNPNNNYIPAWTVPSEPNPVSLF